MSLPGPEARTGSGPLVWAHAEDTDTAQSLLRLGWKLDAVNPAIQLLLSYPAALSLPELPKHENTALAPLEVETPRDLALRTVPDLCLWAGTLRGLRTLGEGRSPTVPCIMINADADKVDQDRPLWFPGRGKTAFTHVRRILCSDREVQARLVRLGLEAGRIELSGMLREGSVALPCRIARLEALSAEIGARPVWLAAQVQPEEAPAVVGAHRIAIRGSHRLLMILGPAEGNAAAPLAERLRDEGWSVAERARDDAIEEITQVYVVEGCAELGLWFRLAPVSFLGSSLVNGAGGCDPFQAAALGSAILYGPNVGQHLKSYSRLANAGAARIVKDASSLAQGLQRLLAPDLAAAQAHAAWEVASEGAETTDRVVSLVTEFLEETGAI
ncbi:3-deoxy-D-manno-octulosonic-acid transferase [Poseidonocella pacifica]|uniref:3-deoxy-D-manno-octulosonic acid transferase n=1 Tax=Poseidonocella pacifica TaxID=871651 RepID=A0A1I0WKB6_9RHOB|nr:hypothetical protein [Poseidonocella pacifica]SFA89235.1 3-deoxy-D-manno-octulosonic-acid transferase [Poseidonocella pacifica]